jgi:hypothetical protein
MLKSWPPGVVWGYNRGNCVYLGKIYLKSSQEPLGKTKPLKFTSKLSDIVHNHIFKKIMATVGELGYNKKLFLHVFLEKKYFQKPLLKKHRIRKAQF